MAALTIPLTVINLAALSHLHVAELEEGTLAYVVATGEYFELRKASGATANGTTIVSPIAGSPIAGAAGARWHLSISGSGAGISPAYAELLTDEQIDAVAPTAPFTFPAGQPVTLVSLPFNFGAGLTLLQMSFVGGLTANVAGETDPLLDLELFLDGIFQARADAIVAWDSRGATSPLDALTATGHMLYQFTATAGPHTAELRWGVVGAVPNVSATCLAAAGINHASMVIQKA